MIIDVTLVVVSVLIVSASKIVLVTSCVIIASLTVVIIVVVPALHAAFAIIIHLTISSGTAISPSMTNVAFNRARIAVARLPVG